MQTHLDNIQAEFDLAKEQHTKAIAEKDKQIAELQELLDAAEGMQELTMFQDHATAAGLSVTQWIKMTLQNSLKYNSVPVTKYAYQRLCQAASRKSTSLARFTNTKAFEQLILNALDNYNL